MTSHPRHVLCFVLLASLRPFAVSSIGCNAEYDVPPDSDCTCQNGSCRVKDD